ncbi:hypothetical protein BKA70DRAFT_1554640 [Coprinopsis sp. MPI-PUGE-AT-0042]|nr:hypothetical protein BKA70DRAFT_1554640 [Coprinopsis sp. MPI-PUGE-AT-0042]
MFAQCSAFVSRQLFSARSVCSRAFPIPSTSFRPLPARLYSTAPVDLELQTMTIMNAQIDKQRLALQTVEQMWAKQSAAALAAAARQPPAGPYSGRSVPVRRGNVAQSIRLLDTILQKNRVRQMLRQQQRHEKRGEKLRRLRSERWRKRFANEVREKVQLVTKIRNRGA